MKLFNANAFESIYTAKNKSEAIVDVVIVSTAPVHECVVICEVLENLIEDDTHKSVIEELKYGTCAFCKCVIAYRGTMSTP